ncbi:LuxR C-terminal-related transcriptional regulator [Albimonas sp. CAU 1670]|uniref:LuxR C-terminal-related transcriptional regulator n=1 Tax=Albimonas sp. CAU 1670 TaxID=3032599 RepID=UPI0023DC3D6C|nr:LuxR C-terminal-related transcriptional regulator [Albimonas sp. CAU 1670]MDF2235002.1 LuxR C-terminal-related transcriptional regulator [Albimonas sp. CAU 1670]
MSRVYIGGKLRPPSITSDHLSRRRLAERFLAAPGARLTVLRAPSGFGKTMLMAECREALAARGLRTAWLALDNGDNDASRFSTGLMAALAELGIEPPEGDGGGGEGWLALLDRLARHPTAFALFLDDFEFVSDDAVLSLVRELIQAFPPGARLVVGSRTPPDLGLGRLRAQGLLQEFDAGDLRFSGPETTEFLTRARGLRLAAEDLARLQDKTEGWPAAVRLASIALERQGEASDFVARFSGSDGAVAEYLAEDVLSAQPPERVQFLLRTSILPRLDPGLCDALHPPGGSAAILEALAAGNVLLTPDDGAYRYHSLFASFLRAQLDRRMPQEKPALHRAAARWYLAAGRAAPAIDHAIEGGDMALAADLLSQHARGFLEQGRMRLLTRWFDALDARAFEGRPELHLIRAWALCFTRGPRATGELLDATGIEADPREQIAAEARAARILVLSISDDYPAAAALAREAMDGPRLDSRYAAASLANSLATVFLGVGAFDDARRALLEVRREVGGSERQAGFSALFADATEGIIDWLEGRMRDAGARFRLALAAGRDDPLSRNGVNAWAAMLHAISLYERNDLRRAAHLFHLHLPTTRDLGLVDHTIIGHVMLSRIADGDGDADAAMGLLGELEHHAERRGLPRVAASARLERARHLMLRGHLDEAREQLRRADDPDVWRRVAALRLRANDTEYPEVGRVRLALHEGRAAEALPILRREIAAAAASGRHRRALHLRLLAGAAHHGAGEYETAAAWLERPLADAAREGAMRMILDEGEPLAEAIRAVANRRAALGAGGAARDPHFRAWLEDLTAAMAPPRRAPAGQDAPEPMLSAPIEALTPKEREVLRLLSEGLPNATIASRLGVSDSTVRTHLRSINSKLDARNRTQAVAVARRMGVLA